MENVPEFTDADHIRIGFNTGILDVLSLLFTNQALITGIEPRDFAKLLRNQMSAIDRQGGHASYVAGRKMVQQSLHDQLANLTLADLRRAMPLPKFQIIQGGKDEAASGNSGTSEGGEDAGASRRQDEEHEGNTSSSADGG